MRKPTNTEVILGIIVFTLSVTLGFTVYSNSLQQGLYHSSLELQKDYLTVLIQKASTNYEKTFYESQLNFTEWELSVWEKTK